MALWGKAKKKFTEEPLPESILGNIRGCAADALEILGGDLANADPATILAAVDDFAWRRQKGERPVGRDFTDEDDARLALGSLWGEQLVRQFGWHWAKLIFHEQDDATSFGVFSSDGSIAVFPLDFMDAYLQNPATDVTVLLSFNMLVAGSIPPQPAGSYTGILSQIQRIIPRG